MAVPWIVYPYVRIPNRLPTNLQQSRWLLLFTWLQFANFIYFIYGNIRVNYICSINVGAMEDIIIPGWVWGIFTVVVLGWMVKLTIMAFKGEKHASVSDTMDERIFHDITRMENKLDETKKDIHVSLDKFDIKFEKFEARMDKMFERSFDLLNKATKS